MPNSIRNLIYGIKQRTDKQVFFICIFCDTLNLFLSRQFLAFSNENMFPQNV